MKILDLLTDDDLNTLYVDELPISFFVELLPTTSVIPQVYEYQLADLYFSTSLEKTLLSRYDRLLEKFGTAGAASIIRKVLQNRYLTKWERIYTALETSTFDPLHDYHLSTDSDKTGNTTAGGTDTRTVAGSYTHTGTVGETGTDTDTTAEKVTTGQAGSATTKSKETTTRESQSTSKYWGFNSQDSRPVGENPATDTATTERAPSDNIVTNEGTVTVTRDAQDNIAEHARDMTTTRDLTDSTDTTESFLHGRTNEYTGHQEYLTQGYRDRPTKNLTSAIEFRKKYIFTDIVIKDINDTITTGVYE